MGHRRCVLRLDGDGKMAQFSERERNLDSTDYKADNLILILTKLWKRLYVEPIEREKVFI